MDAPDYQQLISEGIKGLPPEMLSEVVNLVYLLRRRALDPEGFAEEQRSFLLAAQLRELSQAETRHLEEEFADYEQRHPRR